MPKYKNENTGDIVEYDRPNARLEALSNWERLDPEPGPEPEPSGTPAKSASKADWKAYAISRGMDAEAADKATRDELAALFADGGGS